MNGIFFALTAGLMAHLEPAHFAGALRFDEPVRLQQAAAYFEESGGLGLAAQDLSELPVEQLSREQLQAEYTRLEKARPSLGSPIALTAIGGGLLIAALVVLYIDAVLYFVSGFGTAAFQLAGYILLIFAAALAVTGGVLLAVGLVKLFQRLGQRRAVQQREDDINSRLESLDGAAPPAAVPPPGNAPPPPPPPPGAGFFDVRPTYVLASF